MGFEILPPRVKKILKDLQKINIFSDFYLAGGTGLSILLNHRISVDVDLFSKGKKLDNKDRALLIKRLKKLWDFKILAEKEGTLEIRKGITLISFFHYPYDLVKPLVDFNGIKIASIEDIGLMKISAIIGRGEKKDFIDLYFILQEINLYELLQLGKKKFPAYQSFETLALKSLLYFDDAEKEPMPRMIKQVEWEEVKEFLKKEVYAVANGIFF